MNATMERGADAGRIVVWVAVTAICSAVMAVVAVYMGAIAGTVVVVGLDLNQAIGQPVYAVAYGGMIALYWAVVHFMVVLLGRTTRVPWIIWPAMALPPALWMLAAGWGNYAALENTPGVVGVVGLLGAWFTLGKRRWTRA